MSDAATSASSAAGSRPRPRRRGGAPRARRLLAAAGNDGAELFRLAEAEPEEQDARKLDPSRHPESPAATTGDEISAAARDRGKDRELDRRVVGKQHRPV